MAASRRRGLCVDGPWPQYDSGIAADDVVVMAVQVLGKTRGTMEISLNASEAEAMDAARALNAVKNAIDGKIIAKIIYKPGKILNIIVK